MRRVWDGMHLGLKLAVKVWITFKSSYNANILLGVIQEIVALELHFKEIHSFAPRFNPGCVPPQTRASGDLNWISISDVSKKYATKILGEYSYLLIGLLL